MWECGENWSAVYILILLNKKGIKLSAIDKARMKYIGLAFS